VCSSDLPRSSLEKLLEETFRIFTRGVLFDLLEFSGKLRGNEFARGANAAIQVNRAEQGFVGVRQI
jgi:hypothetical protein